MKGCHCSIYTALQIIELDMLDKLGAAKGVEELRVQLKQQVGSVCCTVAWHPCYACVNRNRQKTGCSCKIPL